MQLIDFSLGEGKLASLKLCFAPTYGSGFKMNSWLVTVFLSLLSSSLVLGVVPGEWQRPKIKANGRTALIRRKICKSLFNDAIT